MPTHSNPSDTFKLACELIARPSVTPDDQGCQDLLSHYLAGSDFNAEHLAFEEVDNLWLRRGNSAPLFCFAGHTDVVPTGDLESWQSDPFKPEVRNGHLYGRGAADMKGSIAAMAVACKRFVKTHPNHKGSIAFLITSDEEGPAKNGTVRVVETLEARDEKIDWCLVGEPSSSNTVGDTIKNGRRGSLGCRLTIQGKQGHVAYPHLAENPIHLATPWLDDLLAIEWDQGNEYFPPTTLQISNITSGTGATNVIPGHIEIIFNLRFSTEITADRIQRDIESLLKKHQLNYKTEWHLSGQPFLTGKGELVNAASDAIQAVQGFATELSTAGGTSDGRFIAPTGCQVAELGPINKTIHQHNECVAVDDLDKLEQIYFKTLENLLV